MGETPRLNRLLWINQYAGTGEYRRLAEAMSRRSGLRLHVLGPRRGYCRYYERAQSLNEYHGPDYDLVTGRVWMSWRDVGGPYVTGMWREFLFFQPDVVHVFAEPYTTLHVQALICRRIFRPTAKVFVLGVENVVDPVPCGRWEALKRRLAHKRSDGVTCWSRTSRNALRAAGFPEKRLYVTNWGVPLERFKPGLRNDELRNRLGLGDSFVLGFVGKMELQKGLWTVLLALKRVAPHIKFLCVGDGHWREGFQAKVREFGLEKRVISVGNVAYDSIAAYMHAMDAVVLPSETTPRVVEQFGRVLVEAMACGIPAIGSDCGGIPEVIGSAGRVFPERDHVALADTVQELAADACLRRCLSELGRERAVNHLSFDALCGRLCAVYGWREHHSQTPEQEAKGSHAPNSDQEGKAVLSCGCEGRQ